MKGFNEAMCTQIYVYFLIFLIRFLQKDIIDIKYVDSVTPKLSHWIIGVFHSITELDPSFFPLGFWRIIHVNLASTVQGGRLRIKL
jgi:hypothetical protein